MLKIQRIILNWAPVAFLLNKSKHIYLPGFQGLPLYDVLRFYSRQIKKQSLTERAAAISYHFIMSLPPSLLFIFTLIPNLPFISRRNIKIQLHRLIFDIIPARTYNQGVIEFIDSFIDNNRIGLLSFGVVLSLFFASNAMMGIMRSFNKDYAGFTNRKGLHKRGIAIRLSLVLFGLLLAYIVLLVLQGNVLNFLVKSNWIKTLIQYSRWVFIILLVFFAIGFIFRYAPAVTKRWNFISPGVILTTFLCLLATLGFAFFVNNFARYNALYGSIGTIMMVMALIFINSLALLIGFELNVSIHALKSNRTDKAGNS
ncbi:MAG: hypothetical protein ABS68_10790 [Niastella sp. SCN 39-18]|nr:YihY/virulence factor BrkB family protein [Sphingobacteriales bacterium]ODT52167.1 MAG: hypothetical protein ABS68_10790 [Niastella sp. SCN 39-18]OJW11127.1 MAG: hypothetical protein BGO53_02140 [Sphingobacteriales bacterium 39-19]